MHLITTTAELETVVAQLSGSDFVTVDTEFIRETTFWPELCLIQMAAPGVTALVDPLASGIDLKPFFDLMADEKVLKVFHAARQDIEIVWHQSGTIPHPIFDTQVAAMVLGYGDSISYDQLVQRITGDTLESSLMAPGRYVLHVLAPGGARSFPVDVKPGETVRLLVPLG